MMKNFLLIYLLITLIALVGCARKKEISAAESCQQQIQLAEQQVTDKSTELDKTLITTINNLITAAKIHAQLNKDMLCIDKTQRALTLMGQQPGATTKQN